MKKKLTHTCTKNVTFSSKLLIVWFEFSRQKRQKSHFFYFHGVILNVCICFTISLYLDHRMMIFTTGCCSTFLQHKCYFFWTLFVHSIGACSTVDRGNCIAPSFSSCLIDLSSRKTAKNERRRRGKELCCQGKNMAKFNLFFPKNPMII